MAYAILFGGIFLGFIFGVVIMALLSIASLPSKPKRDRQSRAILLTPQSVPASSALRQDSAKGFGAGSPLALKGQGGKPGEFPLLGLIGIASS